MPVAVARVKPLSPFAIHDGAAVTTPPSPGAHPCGARRAKIFKFLWFTAGIFLVMLSVR